MQRGSVFVLDSYGSTNFKSANFWTLYSNQDYCFIMQDN